MSWPAGQGEMASAIRSYDWASTPLGPWEAWPSRVRHAVEIMLDLGTPAYVWLGPDFLQLCNDAMLREEAAPARALLGRPAREICPAWSVLEPLAVQVGGAGAPAEGASFMLSPDGGGVWRGFRLSALRNDEGVVEGVLILVLDATAQALAEQEQAAAAVEAKLIAEIQHRTRNVLAVLRSIARRTAENSRTLADCVIHLDARMAAFTQIQSAILRNPGGQVDLASLIADALLAASAREGERVSIEGPPIALGSAAAEKIGLLLHELLMNAVKFGALSAPRGRLVIDWQLRDDQASPPVLALRWRESGVGRVRIKRHGFGLELLERTLPYEMKATVRCDPGADGVSYDIDIPLPANMARS